jgi:hypothetical protein
MPNGTVATQFWILQFYHNMNMYMYMYDTTCSDPNNEDKMVCCDECDKGYHSFCVQCRAVRHS